MKSLVFLILPFLSFSANCQDISGLYRVAYFSYQDTIQVTDENMIETSEYELEFRNLAVGGIAEINTDSINYYRLNGEPIKAKLDSTTDHLTILLNGTKFIIEQSLPDSLMFRPIEDTTSFLVLYPYTRPIVPITESTFSNSHWSLSWPDKSNLELYFTDSSTAFITSRNDEYQYTHIAEWRVFSEANYSILYILDGVNFDPLILYPEVVDKEIKVIGSAGYWGLAATQVNYSFIRNKLLSRNEMIKLQNSLSTTWQLKSLIRPTDYLTDSSEIFYQLKLQTDYSYSIQIEINGTYLDIDEINYSTQEFGTWQLSRNGYFLVLISEDMIYSYYDISEINKNELILNFDMKISNHMFLGVTAKFLESNGP